MRGWHGNRYEHGLASKGIRVSHSRTAQKNITFDTCFDKDKINSISKQVIKANRLIKKLVQKDITLPNKVMCMTDEEISRFEKAGGGHGLFVPPNIIKINPNMDSDGILLNYIHENLHFALPNANENLIDHLTDLVAFQMNIRR